MTELQPYNDHNTALTRSNTKYLPQTEMSVLLSELQREANTHTRIVLT